MKILRGTKKIKIHKKVYILYIALLKNEASWDFWGLNDLLRNKTMTKLKLCKRL